MKEGWFAPLDDEAFDLFLGEVIGDVFLEAFGGLSMVAGAGGGICIV